LRAREARPRRRRKFFRQAGGNAQSSLQGFHCDRERALPSFCGCVGFLIIFLLLLVLGFCWVGEFGLGFVPDEKSKAEKCPCLLACFLSVICCCETRRPFEEEWSTVVSVLDWY
jgi:hypothetical protein